MCRPAFTLIEALVALLLFSLVAGVAITGIVSVLDASSDMRRHNQASTLAADLLDRLVAEERWASAARGGEFTAADAGDQLAAFRWQIETTSRAGGLLQELTVSVSWNDRQPAVHLSTLVPADGFGSAP